MEGEGGGSGAPVRKNNSPMLKVHVTNLFFQRFREVLILCLWWKTLLRCSNFLTMRFFSANRSKFAKLIIIRWIYIEVSSPSHALSLLCPATIPASSSCSLYNLSLGCWSSTIRKLQDGINTMIRRLPRKTWFWNSKRWALSWTCQQTNWRLVMEKESASWSQSCARLACKANSSFVSPSSRTKLVAKTWTTKVMTWVMIWTVMLTLQIWSKVETSLMMRLKISQSLEEAVTAMKMLTIFRTR